MAVTARLKARDRDFWFGEIGHMHVAPTALWIFS